MLSSKYRDRFRTMINVWGDSVVCGIVAHLSKKEIEANQKRLEEEDLTRVGEVNQGIEMRSANSNQLDPNNTTDEKNTNF